MGCLVKDAHGNERELQDAMPVLRPQGAEADCAYCVGKQGCLPRMVRHFYVGEKCTPCGYYRELNDEMREDERLKKLKEVFHPVPRPEDAVKDCLHCRRLEEKLGLMCRSGPWQGKGRVCNNYHEIPIRPEDKPKHCLYCYDNLNCERARVVRIGTPCEKYREYSAGASEKTAS